MAEKIPFWKLVKKYVRGNGPFRPLKLFKHGSQTFYSRKKGGVDGSAQYRSKLTSSMVVFKWEQNLITQIIKSIVANAFILWKLNIKAPLLESTLNIDKFRGSISRGVSFGNFVLDICLKLIRFEDKLAAENLRGDENLVEIDAETPEAQRLQELLKKKKKRVDFLTLRAVSRSGFNFNPINNGILHIINICFMWFGTTPKSQ